ncbi:SusC/RagA family TonB-linked outer membrane protein [Pedobacter lusitanus]|uniref:SusC/RagA family TonB-linked outer membrane protein n=1 Tax=Pedobacter lusitanus TaxID=1503925 RepID=UPI000696D3AE|nr:SusC/RagA family TonB-linked outer membrane protein [Pedobacter lusitanus]
MKCTLPFIKVCCALLILQGIYSNADGKPLSLVSGNFKRINQPPKTLAIVIQGVVKDAQGIPIPGVTIYVKGRKNAMTSTDSSGSFKISVNENDIIIFRMIGFVDKEVPVNGKTNISVILKEDKNDLNEVIVTGYGSINRKKTTAAIASITSKDIENLPAASVDVLLQGKLPGVNVQNFSGQPGVKTSLVVRGNTKIPMSSANFNTDDLYSNPLYVIDGIPIGDDEIRAFDATGTNFLASLNPNDVESIDVLKDASAAALYGSRAANGVILIKTKRGKLGVPRISFNTYHGYTQKPKEVATLIGAAERRQKMDLIYNYGTDLQLRNQVPQLLTDSLNPAFNNNNDYQNLFYQSGAVQNYDISVSGGSEAVNYRIGAGLYNEKGVVINTGYKRYSFNSNVGVNISKNLELITSLRASSGKRLVGSEQPSYNNYRNLFKINPVSMPSSLLQLSGVDRDAALNPYSYKRNDNVNNDLTGSGELRLTFLKDFRVSTRAAISYSTSKQDYSSPSFLQDDGLAYSESISNLRQKYILTNNLVWIKTLAKKHNITATAVQEFESRRNESTDLYGSGVPNDNIKIVNGIPNGKLFGSTDLSTYAKLSYLGAMHYDYDGKYLIDASYRADASSRFGKNNKWGYFPAVSVGWMISNEEFIKKFSWVDELKLRASWGRAGDESSIGDNSRYNAYTYDAGYQGATSTSYGGKTVVIPDYRGITNDNITWQRSDELNLGLDMILFKNRLNLTVDAYTRNTTGQMLSITIPEYSGYLNTFTNAAGVRNSGVEINLSGVAVKAKNFEWRPSLNLSFNKNMVTALPNGNRDLYYTDGSGRTSVYIVGKPINMYYMYINDGVITSTNDLLVNPYTGAVGATKWGTLRLGYPKWRDTNGDYFLSDNAGQNDLTFYGDPNPKVTGGFTNFFRYKGFSVQILTTFTFGRTIVNNTLAKRLSNGLFYGNPEDFAKASISDISKYNYWRQPGDQTTFPAINPYMGLYAWRASQSLFVEPGWYVRIKNVSLSYAFDAKKISWLKAAKIDNLRLYSTIDNLHIFQSFSGVDAERVDGMGYDYGDGYPIPTKYTLGVQVGF